MVFLLQDRVPPLRKLIVHRKSPSKLAFFIVILFFLSTLFFLFLKSPLSKIEIIKFSGLKLAKESELLHLLPFKKGTSYFLLNNSLIKRELKKNPVIEEVAVSRVFPNKVTIKVKEKEVVGYFKTGYQRLLPILSDGLILEKQFGFLEVKRPIFFGWEKGNSLLTLTARKLKKLPLDMLTKIKIIKPVAKSEDQVCIITCNHHFVYIRPCELEKKFKLYKSFENKLPGSLYLLEGIWFKPEK